MNSQMTQAEFIILMGGLTSIACFAFVTQRAMRSLSHGFSIRLQLFLVIFTSSLMTTALIGWWALEKIEAKTVFLLKSHGISREVLTEFVNDFGPKTSLLLALLCLVSALLAWAIGKGIAHPLEELALRAEAIAQGATKDFELNRLSGREIRHLSESLQKMQKSLADRQKFEAFIADLSHDLKNPVAGIKASIEVLLSGAQDEAELRQKFLKRINESTQKLDRLLSDFLNLAKLETRGLVLDSKPCLLNELIEEIAEDFESSASLRQVQILTETQAIEVHVNRIWLERAIENLISNALRYAPAHSTIYLKTKLQPSMKGPYMTKDHPQEVIIQVIDQGPGVDPSIVPTLFERFSELRKKNQVHYNGVGLGLAIVQRVAQAHGGIARLLPTPNGTTGAYFEICIPQKAFSDKIAI
jgi:signal transduction histidine kinase